jgi:hypothetical protein
MPSCIAAIPLHVHCGTGIAMGSFSPVESRYRNADPIYGCQLGTKCPVLHAKVYPIDSGREALAMLSSPLVRVHQLAGPWERSGDPLACCRHLRTAAPLELSEVVAAIATQGAVAMPWGRGG